MTFVSNAVAGQHGRLPERLDSAVIYNSAEACGERRSGQARTSDLLYVGRANHAKRTDLLPDILVRVRDWDSSVRLTLVGPKRKDHLDLDRRFRRNGLSDHVRWEGPVPRRGLEDLYQSAALMVMPSAYEGCPLVVLEALACGLPVAAASVGGIPEIIKDGLNGRLAEPDDIAGLSQACVDLLASRRDRAEKGWQGSLLPDRFRPEVQLTQYIEMYERLVGS